MRNQVITSVAVLLGLAALANGVLMLLYPQQWYWSVPGVPDRGFYNQHFIRDIGMLYMLIGGAFSYGAFYVRYRFQLWLFPALWLSSHALFHFWEVLVGICGPIFLLIDFAGVTLPALLAQGLCWQVKKAEKGA
ncbi:hypothetical protein CWB99_14220 [Pseudoalteromonas rubra]|uniref:DUF4345 domain-containing protein n=1 Tax=Pseudoalteromonas rubra TaxID=43658 RepID=A0A5S3WM12_9GAMM|nr:hypothetical protein [Pseudoalteromonas rubra]TMP27607.1 hypothetical protein CWB99_14220 [Pseudoalteromonas rubra]TMP28910.1 hypothetical protein CWC00_20300 [Pseudoalteromonas rubra]